MGQLQTIIISEGKPNRNLPELRTVLNLLPCGRLFSWFLGRHHRHRVRVLILLVHREVRKCCCSIFKMGTEKKPKQNKKGLKAVCKLYRNAVALPAPVVFWQLCWQSYMEQGTAQMSGELWVLRPWAIPCHPNFFICQLPQPLAAGATWGGSQRSSSSRGWRCPAWWHVPRAPVVPWP